MILRLVNEFRAELAATSASFPDLHRMFPLAALAADYGHFVGRFGPVRGQLSEGAITPPDALVTRTYLMDTWRVFADALRHLILPSVILSVISLAMITRVTRAALLDVLHEDYLRTARAKGLGEGRILLKHALRNASVPILTIVGLQLGQLIGGVVVTETIFSWPGLGLYAVTAVENQDYPALLAFTLITTAVYVTINMAVDLLYPLLSPQTRH